MSLKKQEIEQLEREYKSASYVLRKRWHTFKNIDKSFAVMSSEVVPLQHALMDLPKHSESYRAIESLLDRKIGEMADIREDHKAESCCYALALERFWSASEALANSSPQKIEWHRRRNKGLIPKRRHPVT